MARVMLTDDAKDDIRRLDGSVKARVLKDLQKLKVSSSDRGQPLGSRDRGNLSGLRKLYVGPRPKQGYRAVFAAEGDAVAIVMVVAARSESECYELAAARMQLLADGGERTEMTQLLLSIAGR